MSRSRIGSVLVALSLLAPTAAAQSGPGLPPMVFDQSELFTIITSLSRGESHGHSMMHDGYLAVLRSGRGVDFYDVSNPYSPRRVQQINGMSLVEPHTAAQVSAAGRSLAILMINPNGLGGKGFTIQDWTHLFSPQTLVDYDVPGVPGGYTSGLFWMFVQWPYVYCPVGSLGLAIVDARDPRNPVVVNQVPKTQTGGFNTVLAFAVGNDLILTNSDSGAGYARFDIGDPVNPVLMHSQPTTPFPYGANINGGRLIVPAVSGCASCPGGGNGSFHVFDIGTQSFDLVNTIGLPSRGASAVTQDGFVHIAASAAYLKVDVRDDASYRVVGSLSNPNSGGDLDWVTPMGNFVTMGDDQGFGTHIIPHQTLPDSTPPTVTMVSPRDTAVNQALTTRVGVTMSDMIELASLDREAFFVRPVGGTRVPGAFSHQFGIVNFTPELPLLPDTTYEVVLPAGGVRDWSGNALATTFTSRFSTGGTVSAIAVDVQRGPPVRVGQQVVLDVAAVNGPGTFQYSWSFGDGSPPTPFSSSSQATHTYATAGHYAPVVTVTNGTIQGSGSYIQTVHHPVTPVQPTRSSTIALDEGSGRAWCVNADNDTVSAIGMHPIGKLLEAPVGARPRTLAVAPDGTIWVACEDDATVHVLDPLDGSNVATIALPYASAPYGIAMSPDGSTAYATLRATGELAKLDPASRALVGTTFVGPDPRGIAVAADSERILVTRFISSSDGVPPTAEVYEVSASTFSKVRTIPLALDPGPDTESSGRGLPNYLSSVAISPDGRRAWVPSKKDNIQRGVFRDGERLTFESTVRTISSQIDLGTDQEDLGGRVDFNDRDMAFAVAFSPLGDYAFHALQGSNAIDVRDAYNGQIVGTVEGTGLAPQGLAITSDGATMFVHNFMSRSVSAFDVSGVTASTAFAMPLRANVSTVAGGQLAPEVLRGKQIFYNAADARMNEDGYISCASCHLDGGHDGRTWDFTDRGEGLRNTISLIGKAGTAQGRVHWTANFDEIQDFENDIRGPFGGDGFMSDGDFNSGTVSNPLGQPKAGLSSELDALAAYVSSLTTVGRSPFRQPDGDLTPAGRRGRELFRELRCAQCHAGPDFTDSATGAVHDVGTIGPGSGHASRGPLQGFDTPTLRGLWATAPYLHDGSAPTLRDVLTTRNPAGQHSAANTLSATALADLVAYLRQIDDLEPAAQ